MIIHLLRLSVPSHNLCSCNDVVKYSKNQIDADSVLHNGTETVFQNRKLVLLTL